MAPVNSRHKTAEVNVIPSARRVRMLTLSLVLNSPPRSQRLVGNEYNSLIDEAELHGLRFQLEIGNGRDMSRFPRTKCIIALSTSSGPY